MNEKTTPKIQKVMQMQLETNSCQQTDGNLSPNNGYFVKTQSPSQVLWVSMMLYGMAYPFGVFGFIVQCDMVLTCHILLLISGWYTSLHPGVRCRAGNREGLDAVQEMFSNN